MKTIRIILYLIVNICLVNTISGCKNEGDEPNGVRTLIDKKDSVFLDNGKYIAATTEFTDEEVLNILKSAMWARSSNFYIYDYERIVKKDDLDSKYTYYLFKDGMKYRRAYKIQDLYSGHDFEYDVNNKILTLHEYYRDLAGIIYSEFKVKHKLVAVDVDRIITDTESVSVADLSLFPEINKKQAILREVWIAKK